MKANVHYTASWLQSCIDHEQCREKLQADKKVPASVSTLHTIKNSFGSEKAGSRLTSMLKSVVQNFKENFLPFLEQSTSAVKERLLKNITFTSDHQDLLCHECQVKIFDKYLNMLIEAKVNEMNQTFSDSQKSKI